MKNILLAISLLSIIIVSSCNKKENDEKFNVFTVNKDIELGKELAAYIESDSSGMTVLDSAAYPVAYGHLYRIRDEILNSGEVYYKDDFEWKIRIIYDDDVLNAFCAPGGYIYVYTGIIRYLDNEYELAGVLGHEMAHADKRHSTHQMTSQMGLGLMLAAVGGDSSKVAQVAAGLIGLKYSRNDETQADEWSVKYLCPTEFQADGAAEFFKKIGESPVPEFLSTHPDPEDRVLDITTLYNSMGCGGTTTLGQYNALIASLP